MLRKVLVYILTLGIAFTILFVSVLRTASVRYEVDDTMINWSDVPSNRDVEINYFLAFPGRVLPDNPFWPLKSLRDKFWLSITTDPMRRAELKLLFADKRLGSSQILFERGRVDDALSTLTKAEKYLEEASMEEETIRKGGSDTTEFLFRLANASLRHYQVMQHTIEIVPCEIKPVIIETQVYSKNSFERARNGLLDKAKSPPENPFEW